jgi:L-alanine-DL-glutamate epimerase-like enolase superfamily enzyme
MMHVPGFDHVAALPTPVVLRGIEIYPISGDRGLVAAETTEGVRGYAVTNQWFPVFHTFFIERVAPVFLGRDLRELPRILDDAFRAGSNYKTGLLATTCMAWAELAAWDALGKTAGKNVGELLGGKRRADYPIYLSSLRRDTRAEDEVTWLTERLEATKAQAVKVKIAGRMGADVDAFPGRTEALIAQAAAAWKGRAELLVDANGGYSVKKAIEVGRVLEQHGCAWFEEPCPFEEYERTREVARALDIPIAGGEQDHSLAHFKWMIENRGVDVVLLDIQYIGGLYRALSVAHRAAAAGIPVVPHNPKCGPEAAGALWFMALSEESGRWLEWRADGKGAEVVKAADQPYEPILSVVDGRIGPPAAGPGLGVRYDEAWIASLRRVGRAEPA